MTRTTAITSNCTGRAALYIGRAALRRGRVDWTRKRVHQDGWGRPTVHQPQPPPSIRSHRRAGARADCLFTCMPLAIGLKAETPTLAIVKSFEKGQ